MMLRRLYAVSSPDGTKSLVGAPSQDEALRIAGATPPAPGWSAYLVTPPVKDGVYSVPGGWNRSSTVLMGGRSQTLGAVLDLWSGGSATPKKREYDA